MPCKTINNAPSTSSLSRMQPLALALALAFAGDASLAGAAVATHAAPVGSRASAQPVVPTHLPSPRPDGSVLWPVENCNDAGPGSLRDAAAHANNGDGIDLGALSCSTISVTSGAITLRDVDLVGPGRERLTIDGAGNQNRRIFNHAPSGASGELSISGVTITGGKYLSNAGQGGGCLRSAGGNVVIEDAAFTNCLVVTPAGADGDTRGGAIATYSWTALHNVTISGSWAKTDHGQAQGGALYAAGDIWMVYSTITNNTASGASSNSNGFGGGLFVRGEANILYSTIDGNVASRAYGGAMVEQGGKLQYSTVSNNTSSFGPSGIAFLGIHELGAYIDSSTISGNHSEGSAQGLGGGLFTNTAFVTITNSTITANSETNTASTKFGAGVVFGQSTDSAILNGTIVSGNALDDNEPPYGADDIGGPSTLVIEGGSNLIGWSRPSVPADTSWAFDPRLGPLQDNGGPTRTHMPLPDSPVVDANLDNDNYTDQRGYPRVRGAAADIGSVETGSEISIFANGFEGCQCR